MSVGEIQDASGPAAEGGRTPRYAARRNAIVASAVKVLNRKGVRGMTLGDVAASLNLVPTGVIYYFRNKEALAAACFLRAIEAIDGLTSRARAAAGPRPAIRQFTEGFFELKRQAASGAADQVAVFNDVRGLNDQAVNEAYIAMFRHARELFDGPDDARLPGLHRNARTHLLLSELFWAVAWLRDFEVADYGRAANRTVAILTEGVAAPGAAWPDAQPIDLARAGDRDAETSSELFLRAATKLINAEGYHGASVERIAAELKVSKGAFYHHNETKDELVIACFQRTCDLIWRAIHGAEAIGGSGLQVLVSAACALVERETAGAAPLLRTSALTTVPESIQPDLIARFDRISLRFASILSDGIADGSVRPIDVNVAAQMITGMINAASELTYWAPGLTPQAAANHYVRPLFQGVLSPPAV